MKNKPAPIHKKGRYRLRYRGTKCLNCSHLLDISDRFCPNCSQINSTKKLTLKDFFEEFFASLISYDSKLLKTLSALLLKPGKITQDYISGKRAYYTNPFRFLLSLSIVYFLIIGFTKNFEQFDRLGQTSYKPLDNFSKNFKNLDKRIEEEQKEVTKTLDSLNIAQLLDDETKQRDSLIMTDVYAYYNSIKDNSFGKRYLYKEEIFYTLLNKDTIYSYEDAVKKYDLKPSFESRLAFNTAKIRQRPGSFLDHFISKLPFAVFFFLPVFSLFIWAVYIRKSHSYTDHLIFSFHNTSLLFILLIISYLFNSVFAANSGRIFLIIFLVYLFWAMRNFYKQNVITTIVKYIFLNGIFFTLALFATLVLLAGNVFTY